MEASTETYLEFVAKGYSFLIPLQWIRDIQGIESAKEDLPVLNWSGLLGNIPMEEPEKYSIILTYKDVTFGAAVTQVIGLCEIGRGSVLELREPVRNQKNRFLKAAVVHEGMADRTAFGVERDTGMDNLAFILDPAILLQYLYQGPG